MNSTLKTVVVWVVILLSILVLYQVIKTGGASKQEHEINFAQFMSAVNQGNVKDVTIAGNEVRGQFRNENTAFHTVVPPDYPDMIKARAAVGAAEIKLQTEIGKVIESVHSEYLTALAREQTLVAAELPPRRAERATVGPLHEIPSAAWAAPRQLRRRPDGKNHGDPSPEL